MTIVGLGNPYPTQLELLMLAGIVLGRGGICPNPDRVQIAKTKNVGYRMLRLGTGQDFGFDVEAWYNYLFHNDPSFKKAPSFERMKALLVSMGHNLPDPL